MRLLVAELSHAMKLQAEIRGDDTRQRIVDRIDIFAAHLADKAQSQVQLFAALPARARHPALDQHQGFGDFARKGKSDEQSHCEKRPSGRRLRNSAMVVP